MITNPRFAAIYVSDQQAAVGFWTETVGFQLQTDASYAEDGRWIEVRPPEGQTNLVIAKADPEVARVIRERMGSMSSVWFDCDNLDATFAELKGRGVEFPVEPQAAPWDPSGDTRWAQFTDPEGTLFGLSQRDA